MVNIVHRTEGTCSENCHINKQTDVNYETMDVTKMDNSTHKGLMNKNLKSNDNCTKISKDLSLNEMKNESTVSESISPKLKKELKNSDSRKSSKTKRPTMPIYVPKCKMMAELNQTENGAPKQKIKEDKNIQKKMPNLSITKAPKVEANKKPLQKKCEKELGNNLLSKDSNCSSLNNNSWADIMDNLSTDSRSSPENDLRKNHSDSETLVSQNKKLQNERTSNEHLSYGDHKNVKKNIQQRNMKVSNSNSNVLVKKQGLKKNETTSSKVITGDAVQKPYNNSTLEIPNNLNTNSDIKNINNKKQFQKYSRIYYSFDAKSKERKPDKEKSNPPKLKKNKINKAEETENNIEYMPIPASSAQNTSRGILKVPALYENNEIKSDRFEITSGSPKKISDSCTYIHKKLYDPNNPDKPEIVNIPAPILHEKFNRQDYSTGYIPFSQFANPIPPPHPVVNPLLAYGHGEYIPPPVPLPPEPSSECYTAENKRKKMKPVTEKNLDDISILENNYSTLLLKRFSDSNMKALKDCRLKLQELYTNIILGDPRYCAENNPEQNLWKTAYHQLIESLRKKMEDNPANKESLKEHLLSIIEEGIEFFDNLLKQQEKVNGFVLSKMLEVENISGIIIPDYLKCLLISVQKVLIYLGDLSRYKEQLTQSPNYGKARSYYLKAQQIAPKNGKPYNQLAILACCTRRKLDAVYYYMRSLTASNPFLSAKESLLALFEEAKKRYEAYDKTRPKENDYTEEDDSGRCEIWIKPDGSSNHHSAYSSELANLSDMDLNKRFIVSFLHVHGKLFTKVGMENFSDVLNIMVQEFENLLQRSPILLTTTRLLQLIAVNIFSVMKSLKKGYEHEDRSLFQEQAVYTFMVMMSLLMERCVYLINIFTPNPEEPNKIICSEFATILPVIKIWTDWMSCQNLSTMTVFSKSINIRSNKDVWTSFADLLTAFKKVDTTTPIYNTLVPDTEPLVLDEDVFFAGFVPLMAASVFQAYYPKSVDKVKAKHVHRIKSIEFYGDYLCGLIPSYLKYDVETKKFVSLVSDLPSEESPNTSIHFSSAEETSGDDSFYDSTLEESISKLEVNNEIQALRCKKEALSKAKAQQEKHKARVQAVLQYQTRRIVLKIQPRYLIPDTNCFVEHLGDFKKILDTTNFQVVIPLVVVNELSGLARGNRINGYSTPEHANKVINFSQEAILFLEEQFALRHPHLRAITAKGSVLDTISFRSEEMEKNKGTNDDLILACCKTYIKDRPDLSKSKNRDEPIILFREVVLLTDDRNLRIKALAHNVPVRDVLSFLQWTNF